jgi:predicted O-methyltransferase YrrM
MVSCHFDDAEHAIPRLMKETTVDFVFHDAMHTREDYIRDFNALKDNLPAGAVVLIDNIRWEDPWGHSMHCYEGWIEICADSRVRRAAEIDADMGLLLLH